MSSQALSGSAALSRCVVRSLKTNFPFRDAYEGPRLYRSLTSTRTLAHTHSHSAAACRAHSPARPGRHARVRGALRPCLPVSRVRVRDGPVADFLACPPHGPHGGMEARRGMCTARSPSARATADLHASPCPSFPLGIGIPLYSQGSQRLFNNSQRGSQIELSDGPWRHLGGTVAVVPNNK